MKGKNGILLFVEFLKGLLEVDNGGYNVHPVPPPNSKIKESINKR